MRSVSNFLSGFTIGALIGAIGVLLLTPYSGEELQGKIRTEADRIQTEVKQAAVDRRAELEHQLNALREPQSPAA